MVTKSKAGQKKKVKVLNLKKETVKALTQGEKKEVMGGARRRGESVESLATVYASCIPK